MKKILLLFGLVGLFGLQGCTGPQGPPGDDGYSFETAEVYEITNVDFLSSSFSIVADLPHIISSSDMVLVYRLSDVFEGADVWKLQPENYYFADGTLDFGYDFDFTRYDVSIYMIGNDLQSVDSAYRLDQVFRIVIIPGSFSNKAAVDFKDYNAVIKAYDLNSGAVKRLTHK